MKTDPDKLLSQLVVAAITIFIVVVLLLAAFVFRQIRLQQEIAAVSTDLQVNLIDLEETTEEIQSELDAIRTSIDTVQSQENWETMTELLDDVDKRLESIDEGINDVATGLESVEPVVEAPPAMGVESDVPDVLPDPVDQVFMVFAALIGLASVAIGVLLGIAVKIQNSIPTRGLHHH